MNRQRVYCFDFDGTLTTKDTLVEMIRYSRGTLRCLWGFLRYSPLLVLMKCRLYPNWKAKEKLFAYYYKGETAGDFMRECRGFARDRKDLLRPQATEKLREAVAEGARVFVVSASVDTWVRPFVGDQVEVVGTQVEVVDGRLTGRFRTRNCYGQEKVNRIRALLTGPRSEYEIFAYGDSRGDREMLEDADHGFFQPFR